MADLAPKAEISDAVDASARDFNETDLSQSCAIMNEGESHQFEANATASTPEPETASSDQQVETDGITEYHAFDHNPHERPHSSSSHASATFTGDDDYFDQEGRHAARSTSSRSSISSLPGSVVVYPPGKHDYNGTITPSNFRGHYMQHYIESNNDQPIPVDSKDFKKNTYTSRLSKIAPGVRDRDSPFRHPSSVLAMQMGDEEDCDGYGYEYDNEKTTPSRYRKRRGNGRGHSCQSVSGMSMRSLVSTPPSARWNYKSPPTKGEPVQKEYPLVLLHCTLLPPSLTLPHGLGRPSAQLLEEILPEKYWARWKLLEDKIVNSGVLRDRGLLISHPQEMYDLLEERLLESLELVRPRLGYGHFLGREDEDSADDGAWREMEKVDVEVGLALPVEIKRELERRITEEGKMKIEQELRLLEEEQRRREIYGEPPPPTQEAIDGLGDDVVPPFQSDFDRPSPPPTFEQPEPRATVLSVSTYKHGHEHEMIPAKSDEIDLQTLCANYIRVLASDTRNVALAFLSSKLSHRNTHQTVLHIFAKVNLTLVSPRFSPKHQLHLNLRY
ncbi:predicted protein [Histoplasma mississippiense (nom. inval.)]|uniref:predicted protein n=1 Tax=Ajellomyces capsulatus (strain NAm1 / WU24) TaxID=2059318 RepID=UPI000157BB01|nr:predicted protein [Histoplasma mississippiense (nom. inval.)]EDN05696.1 predicted protein [Histoplasma mississippiense (nom. inval.)]